MAGSAKIGALMVSLGIDSAQFSAGLEKSQKNLANFGKVAASAFKITAIAAAGAAAAMGVAVKGAIDHADALSKSAQKAGVTTEALSRLAYAADFSDVSMESLTSGLGKLSKAMADAVITKTSTSALAFKALGISVTDANGKLRASDVVFTEISDKFARMENGSTKTALAMQLFGKAGAEMIPLLNSGGAELKRMADEADRLGITLSTQTGKDAERFNDTLNLIGKVLQGVTNKVMEAALPALQSFAQTLADPGFASAAMTLATNVIGALDAITKSIMAVINGLQSISDWMNGDGAKAPAGASLRSLYPSAYGKAEGSLDKSLQGIMTGGLPDYGVYGGMLGKDGKINMLGTAGGDLGSTFEPIIKGAGSAKKELIDLTENVGKFTDSSKQMAAAVGDNVGNAFSRLADAVMSGNDALSSTVDILMDLGKQLVSGSISNFFTSLFTGGLTPGMGIGAGAIGRGVYGGNGGFFPGFPGFEGGGYTGMGSRSGGMDGRGGFLAMLHPNESVIDHHAGGTGASNRALQINVTVIGARGNAEIQQMVSAGVAQGLKANNRQLPNLIRDYQMRQG